MFVLMKQENFWNGLVIVAFILKALIINLKKEIKALYCPIINL